MGCDPVPRHLRINALGDRAIAGSQPTGSPGQGRMPSPGRSEPDRRPDPACRAIVDGVFGKALALYTAVRLYAYDAQSNHLHYLCSADDEPDQLPLLIDYVHGNIARQLNALRGREGTFWSRRGTVITVLDGDAQIDRLRYILAQGPKSNLVASPTDWPGACSTPALLGDMTIPAVYRSLDERRRNARRPNPRPDAELAHDVAITLTPLPVWADLAPAALRAKHATLVAEIEAEHAGFTVTFPTAPTGSAALPTSPSPSRPARPRRPAPPPPDSSHAPPHSATSPAAPSRRGRSAGSRRRLTAAIPSPRVPSTLAGAPSPRHSGD